MKILASKFVVIMEMMTKRCWDHSYLDTLWVVQTSGLKNFVVSGNPTDPSFYPNPKNFMYFILGPKFFGFNFYRGHHVRIIFPLKSSDVGFGGERRRCKSLRRYKQEAQLPLRNRASATYFFVAKLISIAHSCL